MTKGPLPRISMVSPSLAPKTASLRVSNFLLLPAASTETALSASAASGAGASVSGRTSAPSGVKYRITVARRLVTPVASVNPKPATTHRSSAAAAIAQRRRRRAG